MSAGTVLADRYELRVRLGAGGAGTVWRGFDTTLHREVAVKLIALDRPTGPDPDNPIQRFRREARVVAGLNHPNIVAAYDFGLAEDVAYLVMELVNGGSIAERLRRLKSSGAKGFDELTAIQLVRQVCAGLAVAHRARLVHRDLKPSNLMLSDGGGQVKIVDFGIARMAEQSRLTSTGSYLGTLPYMAPEQMEASPLDGRADLYSLGCVLHEMVAGRSPYDASTPMQWMAAHQLGTPARLRTHAPLASAALEVLILRLLAKDPQDRPAEADLVGDALAGIEASLGRREVEPPPRPRHEQPTETMDVVPISPPPQRPAGPVSAAGVSVAPVSASAAGVSAAPVSASAAGVSAAPVSASAAPVSTPVPPPVSTPILAPPSRAPTANAPVSPPVVGAASAGPPPPRVTPNPPSVRPTPQRTPQPTPQRTPLPTPQRPASEPPRPTSGSPRPTSVPPRPTSVPPRPTSGPPRPTSGPPRPTSGPPARRRRRLRYVAVAVGVAVAIVVPIVIVNSLPSSHTPAATAGQSVVPVAGECFAPAWANAIDADLNTVYAVDDRVTPVACTQRHAYEVVSVRQPSAADRAAAAPPSLTSDAMPGLYHDCVNDAVAYLGGDWRGAYAWLGIALPSADAWQRGAHWTACLLRPTATWQGIPTQSATSLRNGLRGDRPAAVRCIDIRSNPIDCDQPHAYEAVGVYRAPAGSFPGASAGGRQFKAGCEAKVASYLGLSSVSSYHNPSVGWSWWPSEPDAEQWNIGNRYALCAAYAVRSGHAMSGSVRDLGNKAPQP